QVGFLTHKASTSYGKSLQSYAGRRPGTEIRSRTGESFRGGTYKRGYGDLSLQAYTHAQNIAGHENLDQMLRRFGIGRFHDAESAKLARDNFEHTPEGEAIVKGLGPLSVQRIGPARVVHRGNVETRAMGSVLGDYGLAEHK